MDWKYKAFSPCWSNYKLKMKIWIISWKAVNVLRLNYMKAINLYKMKRVLKKVQKDMKGCYYKLKKNT